MTKYPIAVIALNHADGEQFAKNLGLEDYIVFTQMTRHKMQGCRFKEVVVTLDYVDNLMSVFSTSMTTISMAIREKVY